MLNLNSTHKYLPIVFCAKCNKPVDKIYTYDDPKTRSTVYAVCCHNEEEKVVLSDEELMDVISINFGTAFNENRLPLRSKQWQNQKEDKKLKQRNQEKMKREMYLLIQTIVEKRNG